MKKHIVFLMICATVFLCACSSYENVTFLDCDDGQCLVYQEEKYFAAPGFFVAEGFELANTNDIELGYFYSFPFSTYFYSYTLENPDYICTNGSDIGVYFKEDYAYQTDTFVIVGTEHEFVFSDALTLSTAFAHQGWESYQGEFEITLSPQKHPRIQMPVRVFCVGDIWFACGRQKNALFEVSDDFVKMFTDCRR